MKKRRQHYVWRHYLRAWASSDLIWCYREGRIFRPNLMNIGQIRDFYKLKELSSVDTEFITNLAIKPSHPMLQELNRGWFLFASVFQIKKWADRMGYHDKEMNKVFEEIENNLEEDFHTGIEDSAISYIDSILDGNIEFYKTDEGCIAFAFYLSSQFTRTLKRQNQFLDVFQNLESVHLKDVNLKNIWPILRHIFATNIGCSLYLNKDHYRMILVRNESEIPFITGDQPVINTYAIDARGGSVNGLEFYYPVSPKIAILISEKEEYRERNELSYTKNEVRLFNSYIVKNFHDQIYSCSREALEDLFPTAHLTV